jgi:hypothetical protein
LFCACLRRHPEATACAHAAVAAAADASVPTASAKPRSGAMSRPPPKLVLPGGHGVLSTIRLADVLGHSPHGVVRLAHTQTIADALRILAQYNTLSAPGARPMRAQALNVQCALGFGSSSASEQPSARRRAPPRTQWVLHAPHRARSGCLHQRRGLAQQRHVERRGRCAARDANRMG